MQQVPFFDGHLTLFKFHRYRVALFLYLEPF